VVAVPKGQVPATTNRVLNLAVAVPATAKHAPLGVLLHNKRTFFYYSGSTRELQATGTRKDISRE